MSRPVRRIWVYSTAGSIGVHLVLVAIALILVPRVQPAQAKTAVSIARLAVDLAAPVPGGMVTSIPATLAAELVTPSAAVVAGVQATVAALAPSTAPAVAFGPTNAIVMPSTPSMTAPLQPVASQSIQAENVKPLSPHHAASATAIELTPAQQPAASVATPRLVALAAPAVPLSIMPAEAFAPRPAAAVPSTSTVAAQPSALAAIATPGSAEPSVIASSASSITALPPTSAVAPSTTASLTPTGQAISSGSVARPIQTPGTATPILPAATMAGSTLAPVPPAEMASIAPTPVPPVETPAELGESVRAFVASYQGTPCLAAEVSVAESSADVTAFGSAEASGRFASALRAAFPNRVAALTTVISPDQCAAASLLNQWQNSPGVGAGIDVAETMVENGTNVKADIAFDGGAWVTVFLIDDDGKVTDLSDHLALLDGKVALTAPVVAVGAGAGTSQLLLAVTSSSELATLHSPFGGQASELLPKLLDELNRTDIHAAIAMASFKVYGAGMTLK